MGNGFRTATSGGVAAPPYTNGPYTFSEIMTFEDDVTINGDFSVLGDFSFGDASTDSLSVTGDYSQTYDGTSDGFVVSGSGALTAGKDLARFSSTGNISSTSNVVAIEQSTGAGTAGAYGLYINCTGTNVEAIKVDAGNVVFDEALDVVGIITGGTLTDGAFSVSSGAVTGITTMSMSGNMTMSGNTVSLTHSGSTSLTITSTSGTVIVEGTTFTGAAVSGVSTLEASGILTLTGTSGVINITGIQTPGGWNDGAIFQYGVMNAPIAEGTVSADDLVLKSICASATATGQWLVGEVTQLSTAAASTGYFLGSYNYMLVAHDCGAAIAQYVEIDISGTSALSGNHQGLFSEIIVAAGSVITGAGKICGAAIEMNVVATATVANPVIGLEVDMRDVKVDCAGEMIGIKVTKAGAGNYLDYGLKFSNQFENTTAVIGFDLTQGSAPLAILCETGAHTLTSYAKFTNSTGAITNLFDFSGYGSGNGEIIEADAAEATNIYGKLKIIDCSGNAAYINLWSTPN